MLGVHSGQGKTTLTVYMFVLGVLSGQGISKTFNDFFNFSTKFTDF